MQGSASSRLSPGCRAPEAWPSRALQVSLMGLSARLAHEEAGGRASLATALLFYNVPQNVQKQQQKKRGILEKVSTVPNAGTPLTDFLP